MARRCPCLRLKGKRDQVSVEPSRDHRCYLQYRPERVGAVYQAEICLTPDHRHCPRLVAAFRRGDRPLDQLSPPRPVAPSRPAPRILTLTEYAVLGLGVFLVLALLLIGFGFVYRLVSGPDAEVVPLVAAGPEPTLVEVLPSATSLSTVDSPTPAATEAVLVAPVVSPTPAPEPPIPTPTPYVREPAMSPPTRLVISKIDLDIAVLSVGIKTTNEGGRPRAVWGDVANAGGFHESSAYPGNGGNTVINGHRDMLGAVFRHLDRLGVGDEITLYVGETAYPYVVVETLVVPETFASAEQRAENLRLIGAMPEERLTLVTCTPIALATHRLLVIARPPEPLVPQMPEAGSDPGP